MPRSKKTEKLKKEEVVLDLRQDREEFLRAFEKPTQIYRFLRARHCISPVFLHRSLLYMLDRCSRSNARRKVFHIDDMLDLCKFNHKVSFGSTPPHYDELQVVVTGFYVDPGVSCENSIGKKLCTVDAELSVRKTFRCRRKDGESLHTEEFIDSIEVSVNPRNSDNYLEEPIILNTNDIYHASDGQSVTNYALVFRIYEPSDDHTDTPMESSDNAQSDNESEDTEIISGLKRKHKDDSAGISLKNLTSGTRLRKNLQKVTENKTDSDEDKPLRSDGTGLSRKIKKLTSERMENALYEAELDIFTKDKETLLLDGEYELSLNRKYSGSESGRRNASWEALDGGREIKVLSTMANTPILKFNLVWKQNSKPGPLSDSNLESKSLSNGDEPEAKRVRRRNSNKPVEEEKTETENKEQTERSPPTFPVDLIEYRKSKLSSSKLAKKVESNGMQESKSIVCYQFVYNSETQQQTEARDDLFCPWCQLNCITLYSLIKHLKTNHPRFNFSYIPQATGCYIEVSVNECYDGSYCGNPQFVFSQPGMAFNRRGPVRRVPVTHTLVYRPPRERSIINMDINSLLEKEENEASIATHYDAGHHRLYFHSDTNIPIRPCEFDDDSEEEPDPDWLKDHTKKMLDEFTDVNDGEKPIMKLWNLYIMKHSCIADTQMHDACKSFIDLYGAVIARHHLRRNLLLHLINLVDFGVMKTSALQSLMQHFDKTSNARNVSPRKLNFTNFLTDEISFQPRAVGVKKKPASFVDLFSSDKSTHLFRLQKIIDNSQNDMMNKDN